MTLIRLTKQMSVRKALSYMGASRSMLYYTPVDKKKQTDLDKQVADVVEKISTERPAYGTRRLAAAVSREIKRPVNRK